MTKKHFYFYANNLDNLKHFRSDPFFEKISEYSNADISKSFRNEYGRIETDENYYHLLVGQMPQEGCPWCASEPELLISIRDSILGYNAYYLGCKTCGARGPTLNIDVAIAYDKNSMDQVFQLMKQRFTNRRPWDDGFINPYDNGEF